MTIHKQANTAQNVEATDMTLLEECLDVLKKYSIIEDKELEEQVLSNLKSTFYGKLIFQSMRTLMKLTLRKSVSYLMKVNIMSYGITQQFRSSSAILRIF